MEIKENVSLKGLTTFRIGGQARYFCAVRNKKELEEAVSFSEKEKIPFFVLGGGSNLLISDKGYGGIVIKVNNAGVKMQKEEVIVEAGTSLTVLFKKVIESGLAGFEWAVGIPGTLGGAVRGNAGAFDGEIADNLKEVEAYDMDSGNKLVLSKGECRFGYRSSLFKKNPNLVILTAALEFKKGDKEKIKEKARAYLDHRQKKHPKEPSAGSCFKNVVLDSLPVDFFSKFPEAKEAVGKNILPAAFLIDQCGLKGEKEGSAQVSEKHPNFIVNLNGASSEDVLHLIKRIKEKIREKYGLHLQEEIEILDNNL